ncbi:MFS-type transporter SLC18B1-like isoform X2 [Bacillus rossius redtenbacheri]|uniref:MFS-type transporter SLC18B1-like isoform X2 n=1 Tax=Bacillus rossius redtenbacheri TaxID=93214 RepID=UPI002FDEABE6
MVGVPKFSRQQWLTLVGIGSVYFTSAICISLQAPFYPKEAESKGATATEYGFVFGVFELVAFLFSPVFGKYIDRVGATAMLNVGCFVAAICSMLFGLLDYVYDHTAFIVLSFILRIAESLGTCASVVAAFSIIAEVFPESVATTFATMEVFYGLGFIAGPLIGGAIYGLGGFVLPFMVLGGALLLDSAFIFFIMPRVKGRRSTDAPISGRNTRTGKKGSLLSLMKVPSVALDTFCTTAAALSIGFYSATLEPHLRQFGLSALATGMFMVISGALYTLSAPVIGRLCDTRIYPKKFIAVGSLLIIVSYVLVGPFPALPIKKTLMWMVVLGLVVHGIGFGCILVPCFIDSLRSALAAGFPDNIVTYGLISGLWMSAFSLGAFVGPSVGGLLLDMVHFRWATLFVISVHGVVFVLGLCFVCLERCPCLRGYS